MPLLIISFLAGVLTVAAPCILPLLPVVIGGAITPVNEENRQPRWLRPLVITISLAISVVVFSLLLKATTALLGVPTIVWQIISAVIVILLGINFIQPAFWEKVALKTGLATAPNQFLASTSNSKGTARDILIGVALGPIFTSCSPTYALIVASILPATFITGLAYLLAYAAGLSTMLLLITLLGQRFVQKLGWLSNPSGIFRRIIGILFVLVGVIVLFGWDKKIQIYVLDHGWYGPIVNIEERLH